MTVILLSGDLSDLRKNSMVKAVFQIWIRIGSVFDELQDPDPSFQIRVLITDPDLRVQKSFIKTHQKLFRIHFKFWIQNRKKRIRILNPGYNLKV